MSMSLVARTDQGLYCAVGDFHIDPWTPVPRALITHAHSDHARAGLWAVPFVRNHASAGSAARDRLRTLAFGPKE